MFELKYNITFEKNEENIKEFLSEALEKGAYECGCPHCNGKNITIYVNEFTKNYVEGYSYCHDCNMKTNIHLDHNIYGELNKLESEILKMLKR
ncbi:hypothetical protein ACSAZK_16310 [Methanosarcina sp. Mfa9]|uniref:hypothetical protein n=1 Tax=Methanosarcina sp. Mfa9 TaxID=3439063 RepID=UPI003F846028